MNKNYKSKENIQWIMVRNKPKECLVTNQIDDNWVNALFKNNKNIFKLESIVRIESLYPTKIALLLSFLTEEEKIKLKESL